MGTNSKIQQLPPTVLLYFYFFSIFIVKQRNEEEEAEKYRLAMGFFFPPPVYIIKIHILRVFVYNIREKSLTLQANPLARKASFT